MVEIKKRAHIANKRDKGTFLLPHTWSDILGLREDLQIDTVSVTIRSCARHNSTE